MNKKDIETKEYIELLNKMIELENKKDKHSANPVKITVCIVGGIASVMLMGVLCYFVVKTGFSIESILSTLLAFFSIFISIFFYFKADEASTKFYKSSYDFMKDVSVTLGKIEERFGEKLNNLSDKLSHLDHLSKEKSEEIENQIDDKDKLIDELIAKTNLNAEEKDRFKQEIIEKDKIIEQLKFEEFKARRDAENLRRRIYDSSEMERKIEPSPAMLMRLLKNETDNLSIHSRLRLQRLGFIDENGVVNRERVLKALHEMSDD